MKAQTNATAHVNGDRLWNSILAMAEIGATENGGSNRLAFSDEDNRGRSLFASWCEDAGMTVSTDRFGNMYAHRPGTTQDDPLVIGSHLDTQPKGGRFDGVLGVLGGLEVIRALNDAEIQTDRPIVLVNWTNEEGAVLTPMMGSAVFAGSLPLAEALENRLPDGRSVATALSAMERGAGTAAFGFPISAYLELHIEQGPVLEDEKLTIGVVTGGIGFRRYRIRFEGQEAHAGPTPMTARKDPVVAGSRAIVFADDLARRVQDARSTVGTFDVIGGSPNTVASQVEFTLDLRHPESDIIARMETEFLDMLEKISSQTGTSVRHQLVANSPPAPFDPRVVAVIDDAVQALGLSSRRLPSGAGHDACNISRKYPTGMIFVPSVGGISHNEIEYTSKADCASGAQVLLGAVLELSKL
ncbi:Zn-dependent hydrolase [Agrobacterium burrii]|uniref:Zn-dependent hydrolase n=1 Tax=Agrobacterium burrii TaxID=2815339 RepID=A0ABS3EKX2_9HYPH|nr:Zn-dependent hydrolase [Agrobacterium burrii]MBO0132253.1 Zn-dependent hydrolase [Agrobacterium burrii]